MARDLKQAFRTLRNSPGFAVTAISALALGIGGNTSIFSVVNAVLLKPLPYPSPERLVQIVLSSPNGTANITSIPKFIVQRDTPGLADVSAYDLGGPGINLTAGDRPEQLNGIRVSQNWFHLFGARVALGRTFLPEEDLPRGGRVAILANGFWQRRFGSDPSIIGKAIPLGGEPYTVVGVLASDFMPENPADIYLPLQADPNSVDQAHYLVCTGRLKPGVTLAQANAALQISAETFRRKFPTAFGPQAGFRAVPLQEIVVANVRPALLILLGAVALVLLIACANVANLLLARASGRAREIAIRTAIGAARSRIVRQILTESALLAVIGGAIGLALGAAGVRALLALNPGGIPRIGKAGAAVELDWRVACFTLLLSLLTGLIFGLVPALHASRADLNATLKESGARAGTGMRQQRVRGLLIVTEMALAILLLTGAGLLIRTFLALRGVAPGFDPRNVLTMQTSLTGARFEHTAAVNALVRQVTERVESLPGVKAACVTISLPLEPSFGLPFRIEGRPLTNGPSHGGGAWRYMSPEYFDVFRIPIRRGRGFTVRDDGAAPGVVLINETMARRFWPNEDPVGQRITIAPGAGPLFVEPPREIIGVVADVRDNGLNSDPGIIMYIPFAQVKDGVMALNNRIIPVSWAVRTTVDPYSLATAVQKEIQSAAALPVANIRSMHEVVRGSTSRNDFNTLLLGIFAFCAVLLASIGLYGLMAYSVEQRTLEFGIRLALGADAGSLRNMVVKQAMVLAGAGILIGLTAAYFLTRLMAQLLFGVQAKDPYVFASVAGLLAIVALLAAWLPARRALRIDPIVALRYE